MLTHTLHITLGVHMELHAPLNHHSVLPYVHILVADGDSMDWYVFPWSFLQAKRYVNCIFLCLRRGRYCPEAVCAAQYVLRVLLQNAQHAQHVQNANNTRITRRTRRTRSTEF